MKEMGIGRTERPENKTHVLQGKSCGGHAPISTALWCKRLPAGKRLEKCELGLSS